MIQKNENSPFHYYNISQFDRNKYQDNFISMEKTINSEEQCKYEIDKHTLIIINANCNHKFSIWKLSENSSCHESNINDADRSYYQETFISLENQGSSLTKNVNMKIDKHKLIIINARWH